MQNDLVGIGLYTPSEAGRLIRMPAAKISRWLRGHAANGKDYDPLWETDVDLGDGKVILSFRDLMETRVVDAFIRMGVSAIRMRAAIRLAQDVMSESHPLASNRFRTDGREIFLQVIDKDENGAEREQLLNLFKRQYTFKGVLDPVLQTVDFGDDGNPTIWWPMGRRSNIIVDPKRAFGAPIDGESSIPTSTLAREASVLGVDETAMAYDVSRQAVLRAVEFEGSLGMSQAA